MPLPAHQVFHVGCYALGLVSVSHHLFGCGHHAVDALEGGGKPTDQHLLLSKCSCCATTALSGGGNCVPAALTFTRCLHSTLEQAKVQPRVVPPACVYLDDVISHGADEAAVFARGLLPFAPLLLRFLQDASDEGGQFILEARLTSEHLKTGLKPHWGGGGRCAYLLFGQVLLLQGSQHLLRQQPSHLSDADVRGQFRLLKDSDGHRSGQCADSCLTNTFPPT